MVMTILITGATDGIGLATAQMLVTLGHTVLVHGRHPAKLETVTQSLSGDAGQVEGYLADLARMDQVEALAKAVAAKHTRLDVLINNAGVYSTPNPVTPEGLDVRFVVNAIAPYVLSQQLLPLLGPAGRVINLSSAAQAPVQPEALTGKMRLSDGAAYAQSKLALTMWSCNGLRSQPGTSPAIIAVNPGSMLGSKMVKQAFGVAGGDIRIGAEILTRAALSPEFAAASGQYYDNDIGQFAPPHPDARNPQKSANIVRIIEEILATKLSLQ